MIESDRFAVAYFVVQSGAQSGTEALVDPLRPAFVMGSSSRCDLQLVDPSVEASHAIVFAKQGAFFIQHRFANNVVLLNQKPVGSPQRINPGDIVHVGDVALCFRHDAEYTANTVPPPLPAASASVTAARHEGGPSSPAPSPGISVTSDVDRLAVQLPDIYIPPQQPEILPGAPLWLILYALLVGGTGAIVVYVTATRFGAKEIESIYGSQAPGVALIAAGVLAVVTGFGALALTKWGWWLARLVCAIWIIGSAVLWLQGLTMVSPANRAAYFAAALFGLLSLVSYDTITRFVGGESTGDMIGDTLEGAVPRFIPRPRVIVVPTTAAALALGGAAIALVIPVIVMAVSSIGTFFVVGLLCLEPGIFSKIDKLATAVLSMILVGGIVSNIFLIGLLNFDRARFDSRTARQE